MDVHFSPKCSGSMCYPNRRERAVARGQVIEIVGYSCCTSNESLGCIIYELGRQMGVRVERRDRVMERASRWFGKDAWSAALDLPAVMKNGRHEDFDLIDRSTYGNAFGLKDVKRCKWCRSRPRLGHMTSKCEAEARQRQREMDKANHAQWVIDQEALWAAKDRQVRFNMQRKVVALIRRLCQAPDEEFTLKQASKMLPYRPSPNAIRRMCLTKKLESRKSGRDWIVTARGIMSMIQKWIDCGRAPAQSRASRRMTKSLLEP